MENNLEDGLKLKRFLVEEGKAEIDFEMAKEVAMAFTGSMYELVKDAPNYVEVEVFHKESGEALILTVQKRCGKTAHQLRKEAEAQIELLKAELEDRRVENNKKDQEYLLIRDHNKKLCEKINHLNDLNYELGENLKASEDQNHYFQLMSKYRDENYKLKAELEARNSEDSETWKKLFEYETKKTDALREEIKDLEAEIENRQSMAERVKKYYSSAITSRRILREALINERLEAVSLKAEIEKAREVIRFYSDLNNCKVVEEDYEDARPCKTMSGGLYMTGKKAKEFLKIKDGEP